MKPLIVYYSHEGNIKTITNQINNIINADVYELKLKTPYSDDNKEYVAQVRHEIKEDLSHDFIDLDLDLSKYDTLFIGSANWGKTIVPVVKGFLRKYDLKDFAIYPYFSHGGTGLGGMEDDVKRLTKSNHVKEALLVYQTTLLDEDIKEWIKK